MITGILLGDSLINKKGWQITKYKGKPLLAHPLDAMLESKLDQVILVLGRDYHKILNYIKIPTDKVRVMMSRRFDRGMSSYVRSAANLLNPETEAVLVACGEFPFMNVAFINKMLEIYKKDKPGILVPVCEGQPGQPVIYDAKYFDFLRRLMGNDLGTSLIDKFPADVNRMELKKSNILKDVNSITDLEFSDKNEKTDAMPEKNQKSTAAVEMKGTETKVDSETAEHLHDTRIIPEEGNENKVAGENVPGDEPTDQNPVEITEQVQAERSESGEPGKNEDTADDIAVDSPSVAKSESSGKIQTTSYDKFAALLDRKNPETSSSKIDILLKKTEEQLTREKTPASPADSIQKKNFPGEITKQTAAEQIQMNLNTGKGE
jgi:CTP:molybdopterin cytidylyltransferase MocA